VTDGAAEIFVEAGGAISAWSLFGLMFVLVVLEWLAPRRRSTSSALATRWSSNVALFFVNSYVLRALIPVAGATWAVVCQRRGWGILAWWPLPAWAAIAVGVAALDLAHYLRHLLLHRNAWLWRIHVTHHSDLDFDFTTGLRFHPIDAALSAVVLIGTVALIGAPPAAVVLAELLATASVLFEHCNVRLPRRVDGLLRLLIVTPDMHRIHHSRAAGDTGSNLSTTFSLWDRLFGTYRARSSSSVATEDLEIGLPEFDHPKHLRLHWMLTQPFLRTHRPD
jgi:sterol desaturase/sphingolipid hydroxylase (fatty acid hydroxylase superfamily)